MDKIQGFLDQTAVEICNQLNIWLPQIGGINWWNFYVFDQLSVGQQRGLSSESGKLEDLDFAALLRVLSKNWQEFINHRVCPSITRSGFKYAKEVQDIRNEWAHKRVGSSIDRKDLMRYLDTLTRLLNEISGNEKLITGLNNAWELLVNEKSENIRSLSISDENLSHSNINQNNTYENIKSKVDDGSYVIVSSKPTNALINNLKNNTYIGIDFGTSTTVVSVVILSKDSKTIELKPLAIRQPTVYDDFVEHYLVNSVLTSHNNKVLFGKDAYRLKSKSVEGETTFSSFKMQLGINQTLGYPRSKLFNIKSPQEAATQFFSLLRKGILFAVNDLNLSTNIKYSISVPASFEANQRKDLVECLHLANYQFEYSGLIDEPNAAFLSYLNQSASSPNHFVSTLKKSQKSVLIYDFGAGTCDVSILKVKINDSNVITQNLAISRFMALGGDDIDRTIVKKILLQNIKVNGGNFSEFDEKITSEEISLQIIPWLMPVAELLKVYCTDYLRDLGIDSIREAQEIKYVANTESPEGLKMKDYELSLHLPKLSMSEFVSIIDSFSKPNYLKSDSNFDDFEGEIGEPKYLYAPIENSLGKAEISEKDIDAILFIGGSAKNPLVRSLIANNFPPNSEIIVPRDLQTHVSQGAALHALCHYGLGINVIQPITSEPIFIITKGGGLKLIVPSGSEVPSSSAFVEYLTVARDGQKEIELPLCVSNENKILGLIRIQSPNQKGFRKGEEIIFTCSMTIDKLLDAKVSIAGEVRKTALLNPLSNSELSPKELLMLEAKQNFNESVLNNNGRATAKSCLVYASALEEAGLYLEAAELYIQVEQLNSNLNHATSICYCYSRGGKIQESNRWSEVAYQRRKTAVTAYNYAITFASTSPQYEELLRESVSINPSYPPALKLLGTLLKRKGKVEGIDYLDSVSSLLGEKLKLNTISLSECNILLGVEEEMGRDQMLEKIQSRKKLLSDVPRVFQDENLANANIFLNMTKV